jgi:hypothetical protein
MAETELDRSEAADAARFRWLVAGNGYLLEEMGVGNCSGEEDDAREAVDGWMQEHPFASSGDSEPPRVTCIEPAPPRALSEEERQEIREQAAALGVSPPDIAIG